MNKVAVIMGSDSDLPIVEKAITTLKEFHVPTEVHVFSAHRTPEEARAFAMSARANGFGGILAAAGKSIVLDEKHFDAVTALSGSGPAFFAYMLAAMAEGGEALGLDKTAARLLAEQTMFGTAKFLRTSGADLEKFIASVATKGGTTAAGMAALEQGGDFKRIVAETLAAAAKRSSEL